MAELNMNNVDLSDFNKAREDVLTGLNTEEQFSKRFKLCNQKYLTLVKELNKINDQRNVVIELLTNLQEMYHEKIKNTKEASDGVNSDNEEDKLVMEKGKDDSDESNNEFDELMVKQKSTKKTKKTK